MPADIYVALLEAFQQTAIKYNHTPSMPANIYVTQLQAFQQTGMKYNRTPSVPADIYIPPAADTMNVYSPFKCPYLSPSPMMRFGGNFVIIHVIFCPTHTTYESLPDNLALIRKPHPISMAGTL